IFDEALLFTHRGLSGPAILQVSSYWQEGDAIQVSLLPGQDAFALLRVAKADHAKQEPQTFLSTLLPRRLAKDIVEQLGLVGNLADLSDVKLRALAGAINDWRVIPSGSEGYRTAEVTAGGVDTSGLNS